MSLIHALFALLRASLCRRRHLVFENIALRQQLIVLRRHVERPKVENGDRLFWLAMRTLHSGWRDCLHLVKPATVLKWHRRGWRAYWRHKSRTARIGRPPIPMALVHLIRRLSVENPNWGSPHICNELRLLGHEVSESTVARYMVAARDPRRAQRWTTFLRNHMPLIAACDFFLVPTLTFRSLFVFVVLSHDRRLIRHVAVTERPTSAWAARQLLEAFDEDEPGILLHDRDSIFRGDFARMLKALGIQDLPTAPRSPWMNGYCERVIGTIRRECTDHIIALGERHLLRVLREYVPYYNEARTHLSLDGNAPRKRKREPSPTFALQAAPVLGGLHHRYSRAA